MNQNHQHAEGQRPAGTEVEVEDLAPDELEELRQLLDQATDDGDGIDDDAELDAELSALCAANPSAASDDLDALLTESITLREEEDGIKRARDRLKRTGIDVTERRETEAMIRGWEARKVWEIKANVAVWDSHTCTNCGETHKVFSHLMHYQEHRTAVARRFVKGDDWVAAMPNLVALQEMETPICAGCAEEFGMDITKGQIEWTNG